MKHNYYRLKKLIEVYLDYTFGKDLLVELEYDYGDCYVILTNPEYRTIYYEEFDTLSIKTSSILLLMTKLFGIKYESVKCYFMYWAKDMKYKHNNFIKYY